MPSDHPPTDEIMDAPEIHSPHVPHTGHRWFDFAMGGAALLVSAVSLYVAVHHGETMEKLVQANSFPNIDVISELARSGREGTVRFAISLGNSGVGPARVQTLELWVGTQPIRSVNELGNVIRAGGVVPLEAQVQGSTVIGSLIGAGKSRRLFSLEVAPASYWTKPLLRTTDALNSRVCYCSVFDECYVVDSRLKSALPKHVDACPIPAAPYSDDIAKVLLDKLETDPGNTMAGPSLAR